MRSNCRWTIPGSARTPDQKITALRDKLQEIYDATDMMTERANRIASFTSFFRVRSITAMKGYEPGDLSRLEAGWPSGSSHRLNVKNWFILVAPTIKYRPQYCSTVLQLRETGRHLASPASTPVGPLKNGPKFHVYSFVFLSKALSNNILPRVRLRDSAC
jgi:hypothetical protein